MRGSTEGVGGGTPPQPENPNLLYVYFLPDDCGGGGGVLVGCPSPLLTSPDKR